MAPGGPANQPALSTADPLPSAPPSWLLVTCPLNTSLYKGRTTSTTTLPTRTCSRQTSSAHSHGPRHSSATLPYRPTLLAPKHGITTHTANSLSTQSVNHIQIKGIRTELPHPTNMGNSAVMVLYPTMGTLSMLSMWILRWAWTQMLCVNNSNLHTKCTSRMLHPKHKRAQ